MKNNFLRTLAALTCVLAACADVAPVKDFNTEKMAGKWYMVGIATNAAWFVKHRASMKIASASYVPTEEGHLEFHYARLQDDGTCWRVNQSANKTDTPGRFVYHSHAWNNHNDVRIVDVVYDDYAIIHTIKTKDGASYVSNELFSRSQESSEVVQQKFTQFCLDSGILPENIVLLPKNSECPEEPSTTPSPTVAQ